MWERVCAEVEDILYCSYTSSSLVSYRTGPGCSHFNVTPEMSICVRSSSHADKKALHFVIAICHWCSCGLYEWKTNSTLSIQTISAPIYTLSNGFGFCKMYFRLSCSYELVFVPIVCHHGINIYCVLFCSLLTKSHFELCVCDFEWLSFSDSNAENVLVSHFLTMEWMGWIE